MNDVYVLYRQVFWDYGDSIDILAVGESLELVQGACEQEKFEERIAEWEATAKRLRSPKRIIEHQAALPARELWSWVMVDDEWNYDDYYIRQMELLSSTDIGDRVKR